MEIILGALLIANALIILALKNENWKMFFLFFFFINMILSFNVGNIYKTERVCIQQTTNYCLKYEERIVLTSDILYNVWFWVTIAFVSIIFVYLIVKSLNLI